MTDYTLPPDLVASEVEWRLFDNTAVFSSPLSGAVRTVSRPGNRWGAKMVFRSVSGQDRRRLMSLISALRGRANRLWFTDPAHTLGGSFSCPELLVNNAAVVSVGVGEWLFSDAALSLSADSHLGLRITRANVTADQYVTQPALTTVASAPYAMRGIFMSGKGNNRYSFRAGTAAGGSTLLNGTTRTAEGRYAETFTASGTSTHVSYYDLVSGRSTGDFQFLSWASVSRCALVNGGSQTGGKLAIDGLPTSTERLAIAGDWFEVNGELKRLTADLNSDASGNGYLIFEPTLRSSPADNIPVIFRSPMGKFLLAEESTGWGTRPGILSDIEINLIEDIT